MDRSQKKIVKATKRHSNTRAGKRRCLMRNSSKTSWLNFWPSLASWKKLLREPPNFSVEPNYSASAKEVMAKLRGSSTPSCIIGCTGTFKRQNRLSILRGRPIVVQLRKGMHERENEGTGPRSRSIFNSIA